MAHSKSARKRARQTTARRSRNRAQRSALRTQLKKVNVAVGSGDAAVAQAELKKAMKALDRSARKGLIHRNQAARRKSRLSAKVADLTPG